MQTRQLGSTGEAVSALGLGCMGLVGWYGERDDAEAAATVRRALDMGVTHLDTAAVYQDGANERFVGECIKGRRDEVFLATKCGMERSAEGRIGVDTRPELIKASCDASLRRLDTDRIDLFYLHRIDTEVPIEDSIGALADLVVAGKIRHIGVSEANGDTLRRAHATHPIAALQSELSLWNRETELATCRELGVAFVAYSPLGRGFLTGALKSPADLPADDTRRMFPRFAEAAFADNVAAAMRVRELAESIGVTPAQFALAWVLAQWDCVLPIPGTKKRRYLEDNVGAIAVEIGPERLAEIDQILPQSLVHGERYPEIMLNTLNN